ncbi:unnamed protein product, partial [Prorocentrum cordatum]
MNENILYSAHPLVDQHPLGSTRVMSPNAMTSTPPWIIRACQSCGDYLHGPSVQCESCGGQVHSHCVGVRAGIVVCYACVHDFDAARAQARFQASAQGLGSAMGCGGALAGRAIRAAATGALGGAARLAIGAAQGARSALGGLTAAPLFLQASSSAPLPLVEEYDISDAGSGREVPTHGESGQDVSSELLAELRSMRAEMRALRAENEQLRADAASAVSARSGASVSPEAFGAGGGVDVQQGHGATDVDELYDQSWSAAAATTLLDFVVIEVVMMGEKISRMEGAMKLLEVLPNSRLKQVLQEQARAAGQGRSRVRAATLAQQAAALLAATQGPRPQESDSDQVDFFTDSVGPAPQEAGSGQVGSLAALVDLGALAVEASEDQGANVLARIKASDLPVLSFGKECSAGQKAAIFDRRLQRITLDLGGLHHSIEAYWARVVAVVSEPVSWIAAEAEAINFNFSSCELRLRGLLLHLMPAGVASPCLATRMTSTVDILFGAFVEAGPGTFADKDYALDAVSKGRAVEKQNTYEELQRWMLIVTRLASLGVNAPDPSVQLTTLKTIVAKMVESDQEVKHRYYGFL